MVSLKRGRRCWGTILLLLMVVSSFGFLSSSPRRCIRPCLLTRAHGRLVEMELEAESVLDKSLLSHLQDLIDARAAARWEGQYDEADELRREMDEVKLPKGVQLVLQDVPRAQGGGTTFKLIYELDDDDEPGSTVSTEPGILNLAHAALSVAVSCSDRGLMAPSEERQRLVEQAKSRLQCWDSMDRSIRGHDQKLSLSKLDQITATHNRTNVDNWRAVEAELRGRKAADAAFWFALAGVMDEELFHLLTRVCIKELLRFGHRPSCRVKDVMASANRLAAAGVQQDAELEEVMTTILHAKQPENQDTFPPLLDLHSDSCGLLIWKFATRRRKQRSFRTTVARHWERHGDIRNRNLRVEGNSSDTLDWGDKLSDPSRSLVVDLGCGMGVSLLGLAACPSDDATDWSDCNFIGTDLSGLAIGYARGLASRMGFNGRLAFIHGSAEDLLEKLSTYPGPISRILIQFPTPYRLPTSSTGNSQLPSTVSDGFMVTPRLLRTSCSLLRASQAHPSGLLILQSNCEDVAVWMRNTACTEAEFDTVDAIHPLVTDSAISTPTQRTRNWIAMGGQRAIGKGWSAERLLPRNGWTETEIACVLNKTPMHRIVLVPRAATVA